MEEREEKRGELAGESAHEDIHLASVEQLRLCCQNVVVDRGRDQSVAADWDQGKMQSSDEACGDGKICVHENKLNVHQHCVCIHATHRR